MTVRLYYSWIPWACDGSDKMWFSLMKSFQAKLLVLKIENIWSVAKGALCSKGQVLPVLKTLLPSKTTLFVGIQYLYKVRCRENHAVVINKQQHRQKHLKKCRLSKNSEGGSGLWSSCYHPCCFCCLLHSVVEVVNIIRWILMWCIFDCYFIMCIPFSAYFFLAVYLSAKFGKLSAGWYSVE